MQTLVSYIVMPPRNEGRILDYNTMPTKFCVSLMTIIRAQDITNVIVFDQYLVCGIPIL